MTVTEAEHQALARAFALARRGPRGLNPQVGAVILSPAGEVLAEGWHRGAGTAHAEVDALSHLEADAARGATAVVTLEPCNHTGRTGPCAEALIAAGIARVVFALSDPSELAGGGADTLRAAGIDVEADAAVDAGRELLDSWLTVQRLRRPHVTVKWAQSLDGRAAASDGSSKWITGPIARADVHRRRAGADAIVVGTGTVLADDPALTARTESGELFESQPMPVVLGAREVPTDAAVRQHPLPLFTHEGRDLADLLAALQERGVQHVFVEGGPTIASAFLRAGFADKLLCYIAPTLIGGAGLALSELGVATIDQQRRLEISSLERLGDDLLIVATPRFDSVPSLNEREKETS